MQRSPLAPTSFPALPAIGGVKLATASCEIRYKAREDVLLVAMEPGTQAAGVFTRSLTASAPVLACREALKAGSARVLVVNSGNSNAFTGKAGVASIERVRKKSCELADCNPSEFFMASTGVIGEKLPDEKITAALENLFSSVGEGWWDKAARAIMTTDTYPKMATRSATIGGKKITINGIAKGSGMIAPDMATMLAFVFTDANIPAAILQEMLSEANAQSFNAITVDGDTSTSDTLLLFATGKAGNDPKADLAEFKKALTELLHELALLVVKDGEGAEKLITITVTGAASPKAARVIGMSIANSPLVKTAIAAADANWGRIVMAVGKAGEAADRDKLSIHIGGVSVAKEGMIDPDYKESQLASHMQGRDISILVDVGVGSASSTVYSCDLTHRYIDINGSYRT
ncbi:MAG: bifunctional glutamate N-acetyltransferase/amino-acid acetyltransferase ArgJ [Alphaproteobacteria bacterium]|nr:bifunctional glutamate N-acetyltransferase/amino-acid acetyltransferase ArgJ [Alphaproteobacteria bacterium]